MTDLPSEDGPFMNVWLPESFTDTGFVEHAFQDGSYIKATAVKSKGDSGGFMIQLEIVDEVKKHLCDVTLDKMAAMCVVDAITKNLINQEEVKLNGKNHGLGRIGGEGESVEA